MEEWVERFWPKVDVRGEDECWEWLGCRAGRGYGQLSVDGRGQCAHRLAWELANGPIPEGMCVCHHCDNKGCVNPAHLFLGTVADNNRDMRAKGRAARGAKNGRAKLTTAQVREIRRLYAAGNDTQRTLQKQFGVSHMQVCRILRRECWKHLSSS